MKYCCTSPIMRSANSVEKMQVFCAWSSFRMSACTVPRTSDSVSARIFSYVSRSSSRSPVALVRGSLATLQKLRDLAFGVRPLAGRAQVPLDALVDRRVHEHREDH